MASQGVVYFTVIRDFRADVKLFRKSIFVPSSMPRVGAPPGMKEDRLERDRGQDENGRPRYEHEREPEAVSRYPFAPPVVAL